MSRLRGFLAIALLTGLFTSNLLVAAHDPAGPGTTDHDDGSEPEPYAEFWEFTGMTGGAAATAGDARITCPRLASCTIHAHDPAQTVTTPSSLSDPITHSRFSVHYDADLETLLLELTYPRGLLDVSDLQMTLSCTDAIDAGDACHHVSAPIPHPTIRLDRDDLEAQGHDPTGAWLLEIDVVEAIWTNGHTIGLGAGHQQPYTLHASLFYHEPAPAGFSAVPED